jgi:hypothetical protein
MSEQSAPVNNSPGFLSLLALVFITLKLTGYIDWSWWWVTAPLWGGLVLLLAISAVVLVALGITWVISQLVAWIMERRKHDES